MEKMLVNESIIPINMQTNQNETNNHNHVPARGTLTVAPVSCSHSATLDMK